MAEYIEREAVLNAIDEYFHTTNPDGDEQIGVLKSRKVVRAFPAADVVKRERGEWKVYFDGKYLMCSACKASFWDEGGSGGTNFCPACGADMRPEGGAV